MHVDMKEITAVSNINRQVRFDGYLPIHKALRLYMGQMMVATGQLDATDIFATRKLCAELELFCDFCASHLEHENEFIHPALEAHAPGTSQRIAGEHVQHERDIAELRACVRALADAPASERGFATHAVYRAMSLFVSHNLAHMYIEETVHNQALWQHYTDDELRSIERALVGSLPPEQTLHTMRWMIPALNPNERAGLLSGVKASAPAPILDALMQLARGVLAPAEWARLASVIDYSDSAGLVNYRG